MSDIIWESKLDQIYDCQVTRIDEYKGLLRVTNTNNDFILMEREVGLSYGAKFGPDVDDVCEWQNLIVETIDNQ